MFFYPSIYLFIFHRVDARLSVKSSLTFLISITALPMKTAVIKKRRGRWVGVNGSSNREKRERERKRRKCLQGKLLKKVQAGWLGSSSKRVGPLPSPAPKWQLLAPPLNTQCLVAKLCLSLTDEWGKERKTGGGNTKCCYSLSFGGAGKKTNLKEVLAPCTPLQTHTYNNNNINKG